MKWIIDIPESTITDLKKKENRTEVDIAVLNGTPLPKGHGRLIDADELKKHKYHDSNRYENAVAVAHIDYAPTIIEADKEQEDGK